jgi:uroporphyrinogen-III synthase
MMRGSTPGAGDLAGVGVAVTRPGTSTGRLGELLHARGALVVHWPCVRFDPPADPAPLAGAVECAPSYDWLVVTSPHAARRWLEAWAAGPHSAVRQRIPAAVTGPATASVLREGGWPVERTGDEYSACGLLDAFAAAGDAGGSRVLFPCSNLAGDELPEGLRRLGADVERIVAYRTVPTPPDAVELRRAVEAGTVHVVTFTSPSTVEGFLAGADATTASLVRRRLAAVAIGATTAGALEAAGWPAIVADDASVEALADAAARAAQGLRVRRGTS